MATITLDSLKSGMKAKSTLHNWDILVAYHEDGLNTLLDDQHKKLPATTTNITFDAESYDLKTQENDTMTWNIALTNPSLKIVAADGTVELSFDFTGKFKYKSVGKDRDIPLNTKFVCTPKLNTVVGVVNWKDAASSTSATAAPVASTDKVVLFDDQKSSGGHIILDLTPPDPKLLPMQFTREGGQASKEYESTIDEIRRHFKEVGLKYHLGTISNETSSTAGEVRLKPKTFAMTVALGDKTKTPPQASNILFWIQVDGSSSTGDTASDTNKPLLFTISGQTGQVSPVVQGKTACIILSQNLIFTLLLKPALEKYSYSKIETKTDSKSEGGIYLKGTPGDHTCKIDSYNGGDNGFNEISFNMKDADTNFFVGSSGSSASMTYNANNINFWEHYYVNIGKGINRQQRTRDGQVDVEFKATATGTWASDAGSNAFSLVFNFPGTFAATARAHEQSIVKEILGLATETLSPKLNNLQMPVPTVKLDMGAINYFLTTNLLMPGEHVFVADALSTGLSVPYDVLITGQLAKPKT